MSRHSENPEPPASLRNKIIGLGEQSFRKSYYPQLQQRLEEIEKSRLYSEERSAALLNMLEDLEKTRKELADSETRYRSLVENINDVIFSLDTNGTVTSLMFSTSER
jgi:PAS domain-containing protein